jgi:hypothetical protein
MRLQQLSLVSECNAGAPTRKCIFDQRADFVSEIVRMLRGQRKNERAEIASFGSRGSGDNNVAHGKAMGKHDRKWPESPGRGDTIPASGHVSFVEHESWGIVDAVPL